MSESTQKEVIRKWWAENPMTYGEVHGQAIYRTKQDSTETVRMGSREFFEKVDQTFYSWNRALHTEAGFFAKIFPYDLYRGKRVLEIGCGLGTMALNWAQHGAQISATDLNPVAVAQTARRFKLFGVSGNILQMDAHSSCFSDDGFDYIYSWGVLHHSQELTRSVSELFRVLRPEGGFGVMLYHRNSILYRFDIQYTEGFLHGESRFLSPIQLASRYADGAREEGNPHTWPVTRQEVVELFSPFSADLTIKVFGMDLDYSFQWLLPKLHHYVPLLVKKAWARRWGWSLWISGTKNS